MYGAWIGVDRGGRTRLARHRLLTSINHRWPQFSLSSHRLWRPARCLRPCPEYGSGDDHDQAHRRRLATRSIYQGPASVLRQKL